MAIDSLEKQIRFQIKQLSSFSENAYESDECLKYLSSIDKLSIERSNRAKIADILVELNYPAVCINLLRYYDAKHIFSSDRVWFCAYYLLHAIWNFSDQSKQLSLQATEAGYIPILLSYISNAEILDNRDENEEQLLKMSINILHNAAQNPETKVIFRENNGTKLIKQFSRINHDQLKVLAYLCLAHIVNEDETRELNDASGGTIKFIINNLKESYKKDEHKYKGISSGEYLSGLTKLAINRENKFKMLECGILGLFREILKYDNPIDEQKHTLSCLWSLCFEDKIRDVIKKDKDFLIVLNNLLEHTPSDELRKACAGIFYTLNELSKKTAEYKSTSPNRINQKGHIMISYNIGSRDLCVKLKDKLKSDGFKVWIDIEQIQGSALQSMAEAVESSAMILICITERYYQSPNCRLEAEYAVRLNKPIIPLLMQHKYVPQGWLGISIGSRIYYNFASYSIEEKYPLLLKEIKSYYGILDDQNQDKRDQSAHTSPKRQITPPPRNNLKIMEATPINITHTIIPVIEKSNKMKKISNWSARDVREWITKLNLTALEIGAFDDVDGPCLVELHEVKIKAPEFFFNLLKEKLTSWRKLSTGDWEKYYKLSDFLKLSSELSNLFKEDA